MGEIWACDASYFKPRSSASTSPRWFVELFDTTLASFIAGLFRLFLKTTAAAHYVGLQFFLCSCHASVNTATVLSLISLIWAFT